MASKDERVVRSFLVGWKRRLRASSVSLRVRRRIRETIETDNLLSFWCGKQRSTLKHRESL